MPTALPPTTDWTDPSVTEGGFKTAQGNLRDYLSGLLGTDGAQATALASLGAALNGVVSKTAAYSVVVGDRGKLFACSGAWTLSLPAVATVGDGFVVGVRNTGTGTITVDGNAAEQIDGAATLDIDKGDAVILVCDGAAWHSIGGMSGGTGYRILELTGTGSYTPASDVTEFYALVLGATGGNRQWPSYGAYGSGGAGYAEKHYPNPAGPYSFSIGDGGLGATPTDGGTTTFDVISITGSGAGYTSSYPGAGGVASGGDFNANGGAGGASCGYYAGGGGGAGSRCGVGGSGAGGCDGPGLGGGGGTGGNNAAGVTGGTAGSESGSALTLPLPIAPYGTGSYQAGQDGGTSKNGGQGADAQFDLLYITTLFGGRGGGLGGIGANTTGSTIKDGDAGVITILEVL